MNKYAPLKLHRVKNRQNPWITRDIISLMYRRDHIHKKAIKSGDPGLFKEYLKCRNTVVNSIRLAKKKYYTDEVHESKGSKHMWKTLRHLIKSKPSDKSIPLTSDAFNTYFPEVGPKLHENFPNTQDLHWTQPDCIHRFRFTHISEDDVLNDLHALSPPPLKS